MISLPTVQEVAAEGGEGRMVVLYCSAALSLGENKDGNFRACTKLRIC